MRIGTATLRGRPENHWIELSADTPDGLKTAIQMLTKRSGFPDLPKRGKKKSNPFTPTSSNTYLKLDVSVCATEQHAYCPNASNTFPGMPACRE